MKEKHLIVVSVDALVFEDLEYAKTLPAFGRLMREGSHIERIRTIYPSLTHPVHATMMSGNPAGVTGVVSNELFTPGNLERPWFNFLDQMKCKTIFHVAHEAGLTTAATRGSHRKTKRGLIGSGKCREGGLGLVQIVGSEGHAFTLVSGDGNAAKAAENQKSN